MTSILLPRFLCLLVSNAFGCFLTAEVVCRKLTGKPCKELGTSGNPGMANIMAHLGFKPGITVLFGDIMKTVLAIVVCILLFSGDETGHPVVNLISFGSSSLLGDTVLFTKESAVSAPGLGIIAAYYAALGTTLGHNYPFWQRFHGGKGVATGCTGITLVNPLWGIISMLAGMCVTFATQYLSVGAFTIPLFFAIPSWIVLGPEAGIISIVMALLSFIKNWPQFKLIPSGQAERVDVLGAIKKKWFHKK